MRFRNLIAGAAVLAGVGTVIATVASADPMAGDPYTQNPTPEERMQTQQLNEQAIGQAETSARPSPLAQAQYEDQMDRYRAQMQDYRYQRAAYSAERSRYEYDRSHPEWWWRSNFRRASVDDLYDVPRYELIGMPVLREDGRRVGRIVNVDRDGDGDLRRVMVRLPGERHAWVDADGLRYDTRDGIVFTELSMSELYDMSRQG